jgi:hypothetical protein
MRVELKNIKENRTMSDETPCFSATVYVDGKKVGWVINRGTGGCNSYDLPRTLLDKLEVASAKRVGHDFEAFDAVTYELLDLHNLRREAKRTKAEFPVRARRGKDEFGWREEYLLGFSSREAYQQHDLSKWDETTPVQDLPRHVDL